MKVNIIQCFPDLSSVETVERVFAGFQQALFSFPNTTHLTMVPRCWLEYYRFHYSSLSAVSTYQNYLHFKGLT